MTELLKLLQESRAWSIEALAQELDLSPGQVKRQMEFLEELGYLRRVNACGHDCRGCTAHCGMAGLQEDCMPIFWETTKRFAP